MKFILLLPLLLALAGHAAGIDGRVVGITDGDTVTVLDSDKVQHRIRLAGIDAPEKRQDFGSRSKDSLSELVFGRIVFVQTEKKDRYGRDIGKLFVQGVDVSLAQVQRGLAWHYKAYEHEQSAHDRKLYNFAEADARTHRRGLWAAPDPVPPWDFRRKKRNK